MKAIRWVVMIAVVGAGLAAGATASCGIDDEVVWITGGSCTGECNQRIAPDYSCDVDLSCTPTASCQDWDCDESPGGGGLDGGAEDAAGGDGGDASGWDSDDPDATTGDTTGDHDADEGDNGYVPPDDFCDPTGAGDRADDASVLVLGETLEDRMACPRSSQWYRFTATSGTRFAVEIGAPAGALGFRLYAGSELAAVAEGEVDGDASFSATAAASGTFYLRIRSQVEESVEYDLTVRAVE